MELVWEAASVGLLALLVYARTLCRTVYVGDSGELIAAVHTLGIPHPPGYPLYVLSGKAFSLIFRWGNPAFRLNLFSACCAATSVIVWDLVLRNVGVPAAPAAASALAMAFGASLWSQATVARVYAPAALAVSVVFLFAGLWIRSPQETLWLAAALAATGAGIAIHPMVGTLLPGLILAAAMLRPEVFISARSFKLVLCVFPGLLLYLWIPLRARTNPPVRWRSLKTSKDFIYFFLRREYWKFRYVRSTRQAIQLIVFYCRRIAHEYGVLGAAATSVGMILMFRESRLMFGLVIGTVCASALSMILHARREDIFFWPRYMIGAWIALAMPMAIGWTWVLGFFPIQIRWLAAFLLPSILFAKQFRRRDLSRHRYAEEYSARVLRSLPPNAILIADDDNVLFPLMYLHHVLKQRQDVKLIDVAARDGGPLTFNPGRDAVYCTHYQKAFVRAARAGDVGSTLVPEGLLYRIIPSDMNYVPANLWPAAMPPDIADDSIPRDFMTRRLLANACIMRAEWESQRDNGATEAWCTKAASLGWDCDVILNNVGVILAREGLNNLSAGYLAAAAKIERGGGDWSDETG